MKFDTFSLMQAVSINGYEIFFYEKIYKKNLQDLQKYNHEFATSKTLRYVNFIISQKTGHLLYFFWDMALCHKTIILKNFNITELLNTNIETRQVNPNDEYIVLILNIPGECSSVSKLCLSSSEKLFFSFSLTDTTSA